MRNCVFGNGSLGVRKTRKSALSQCPVLYVYIYIYIHTYIHTYMQGLKDTKSSPLGRPVPCPASALRAPPALNKEGSRQYLHCVCYFAV